MNNLARGGVVLALMSLFVVFMYAQTQSASPAIANDSQQIAENVVNEVDNNIATSPTPDEKDKKNKKLVTKTVLTSKTTTATAAAGGRSLGSFTATAYCLQGRTASGSGVRRGIVAADPRVLRLGSRITINGGGYNGSYLVADTGGSIKGRRLDIWVASCSEARRFGRRSVSVSIN